MKLKKSPNVCTATTAPGAALSSLEFPTKGFEKIKFEVLLHALRRHDIFVSAESACSSNKPSLSGVLLAIGIDRKLIDCAIRISLYTQTTEEEILYAIDVIKIDPSY